MVLTEGGAVSKRTFDIVGRNGIPIRTLKEWGEVAKPAKAEHWQDDRSAVELAREWLEGTGESVLVALLNSHALTRRLKIKGGVAEAQTAFDQWPGGRRNHDLLLRGVAAGGPTVVGIEGKADEPFGQRVGAYASSAQRLIEQGKRTNAHLRLAQLTDESRFWNPFRLPFLLTHSTKAPA